jgi:hypothetical protein
MALTPYDVWAYKGRGTRLDERDAYAYLRGTNAAVEALTAQVAELTATVAQLTERLADTDSQG